MNNSRGVWRCLLLPHPAVLTVLWPVSIAMLIYCLAWRGGEGVICYLSYVLSAYSLTVLCARLPRIWRSLRTENRLLLRWKGDLRWRVNLSLYGSLAFNTAYAILQLGLGVYHAQGWFYALGVYYLLLALMRFSLLRYSATHAPGERIKNELFQYRLCGFILLFMNLVLGALVFFITYRNRVFLHHQITTIAMATYTFTALGVAIAGYYRYRKHQSPVLSAVKTVSLSAALVSLLTLENAMLNVFGTAEQESFRRLMTGISGTVVVLFLLFVAIFIIIHATKAAHNIDEQEKTNGSQSKQ